MKIAGPDRRSKSLEPRQATPTPRSRQYASAHNRREIFASRVVWLFPGPDPVVGGREGDPAPGRVPPAPPIPPAHDRRDGLRSIRRRELWHDRTNMRQLNKNDALFLASESAHSNSNVSLIQIYDPSTAPGGRLRFKSVLALVESRLHRSPIFRQKLRQVPFGLDDPYWIEDENFDLEYHVRNIALPKPGDWRQFCIQASRIHARPLDLNRPLWEIYVIEGLDSLLDLPKDSFALLTKLHHAAIDVEQGTEIITLLHDATPHPPKVEPPLPWFPESPPNDLELVCRGVVHTATSPRRLARPIVNALARVVPAARSFASELLQRQDSGPGDPVQFDRVALPGVRDAPLPARRIPRDPPARPRCDDQRRRARGVRGGFAPVPRGERRAAGPRSLDDVSRLRAGFRREAAGGVGAPGARRDHRRPGQAARLRQGADGGVRAHVARDRRARTHRHRHACSGRHVGAHRQDAGARAARGGPPCAARRTARSPTCRGRRLRSTSTARA